LRKLQAATAQKGYRRCLVEQAEQAELQTEIAEREAEGFRVVVVSWQRW
jgi:hypothetical protein